MKIISWNLRFDNKFYKKSIDHCIKKNPDIALFQEVSKNSLDYLKKSNYFVYETLVTTGKREVYNSYLATISKKELSNMTEIITQKEDINTPYEKFLFVYFKAKKLYCKAQSFDLEDDTKIFNLHLSAFVGAKKRIDQFKVVLKNMDKKKNNIIAGDLNVLGTRLRNTILSPIMKIDKKDIDLDERHEFNKLFKKYYLTNHFEGDITFPIPFFRIQPDHILLPDHLEIKSKSISRKLHWSDHKMISVEI